MTEAPYKSLVMEIRPRLQSVNVFIKFSCNLVSKDLKILLNENNFKVMLKTRDHTVNCDQFRIVPDSLSSFTVRNNHASFRFTTENIEPQLGSRKYEVIQLEAPNPMVTSSEALIKPGAAYKIRCANCLQVLNNEIRFKRILPLPRSSDTSEWFCHNHNERKTEKNLLLGVQDAFYSQCFIQVHKSLAGGVIESDTCLICGRCLSCLGSILNGSTATYKIWFNTILFNDWKSSALEDVLRMIHEALENPLLSSLRMVLYCQSSYVLLWVIEKKLSVRFDIQGATREVYDANVSKLLFRFIKNRTELVTRWFEDLNVSSLEISKPMMVELLKHLYEMNGYIPNDFNTSNDFFISYLMLNPNDNK